MSAIIIMFFIKDSAGIGKENQTSNEESRIFFAVKLFELGIVDSLLSPYFLYWKLTGISLPGIQVWEQSKLLKAKFQTSGKMFPSSSSVFSKIFLLAFCPRDRDRVSSFENWCCLSHIIGKINSFFQIENNWLHIWISNPVLIDSLHPSSSH